MFVKSTDTHAHIHFDTFAGEVDGILRRAQENSVSRIITVGVSTHDSRKAVELAAQYENVWAAVGIHPHEATEAEQGISYIRELAARRTVVAIGECGLDFYKVTTDHKVQERALRAQIECALELDLPLIFHVRDAFDHFFAIMKDYPSARGVVHSFSGGQRELESVLTMNLHIGLNGIMTFTKNDEQLQAAKHVPSDRLLLETDCPFLSPVPHRGKTNEPMRIVDIAIFLAELRGESVEEVCSSTAQNSERLFSL